MNPPKEQLELLEANSKALKSISAWSGMNLQTVKEGAELFDAINCEKDYKLPLPDWADEVLQNGAFEDMANMTMALFSWTETMKKIMAGPLITDILNNMFRQFETSTAENIFIYSGHDLTLSTITRTLHLDTQIPKVIKTSSGLVFELHSIDGAPIVQVGTFNLEGVLAND